MLRKNCLKKKVETESEEKGGKRQRERERGN